MKDQLPSPDFDGRGYERPNQKWSCGWLSEGKACPKGPDSKGHCGAVPECRPALEAKEGEKGYYVCKRPKDRGGPCEIGPRADGSCGQPLLRCQPNLTLRAKRGLLTKAVVAFTIAALLLIFYSSYRWKFISPGEISLRHRSIAFKEQALALHGAHQQCATCHPAGGSGPVGWIQTAAVADPQPFEFRKLLLNPEPKTTRLDTACQKCHPAHGFHEPNVAWNYSCSACHREHQGSGPMKQVDAQHCLRCHADAAVMLAAAEKGRKLSTNDFAFQHDWTRVSFLTARPENGFTKVIHEFSTDHPEFQIHTGKFKDPNTLRFSHATHLSDKMPMVKNRKLDCAYCHQPGADGRYYGKITFEKNCQACHSLQFDKETPDLTIPHGDPSFVHAFLRSLPQQYADFATRSQNISAKADVEKFVRERLRSLRSQFGAGEELEQKIFFSDERTAPSSNIGRLGDKGRSLFPGCAYCHEVKAGEDLPKITEPIMPERWLSRGKFDHSKHRELGCAMCHQPSVSKQASDILIPSKAVCASCHKPQGSGRSDCFECHSYHNQPEVPFQKVTLRK